MLSELSQTLFILLWLLKLMAMIAHFDLNLLEFLS